MNKYKKLECKQNKTQKQKILYLLHKNLYKTLNYKFTNIMKNQMKNQMKKS